jgi:hypothetical protein
MFVRNNICFELIFLTLQTSLNNYKYIVGAVNYNRNHWNLLFVDVRKSTVSYIDPFECSIIRLNSVLKHWRRFRNKKLHVKFKIQIFNKNNNNLCLALFNIAVSIV